MDNKSNQSLLKEIADLTVENKKLKSRKKYGLVWEEKPEQVVELCKQKLPVLAEEQNKEIKTDTEKPVNILIEGDNYQSLSVLNYTHNGKIDVIYIDPPYNRGNKDFKYNDTFVDIEDSYRHSKWSSFMDRRLRLAKNLLKDKGVMFISIDDNEYANLKLLCDEIFGERMIETYIWCLQDKTEGSFVKTSKNTVRKEHEYLLACFKSQVKFRKYKTEKNFAEGSFSNPDNDPKGQWFSGNISRNGIKSTTGSKYFTIETPTGVKYTRNWTLSKEEYADLLSKGEIYFSRDGDGVPRQKIYKSSETYSIQSSLFTDVHTSITGKNELKDLFNGVIPFDYPKPSTLIKRLIEISTPTNCSVVLDFFAGSGTTGQAVLELNKDGGNRKFILCTNNESKIAEAVCYPRIKKIIEGYKNIKGEKIKGISCNLKYFKTDFVEAKQTDQNKKKLVDKSTEMLCLKEDCFDLIKKGPNFKIFTNNQDKYLGIIYDDAGIELFKKEAQKINKKIITYIFSLDDSAREEEFEDIEKLVELKPIPAVILNVYKRIFK